MDPLPPEHDPSFRPISNLCTLARACPFSSALAAQELPRHASSEWIASRASDRACQTSTFSSLHQHRKPGALHHLSVTETPESTTTTTTSVHSSRHGSASAKATTGGTSASGHEELTKGSRNDIVGGVSMRRGVYDDDDECVTLAITTCKRVRGFLGTIEGLQVRFFQRPRHASVPNVKRRSPTIAATTTPSSSNGPHENERLQLYLLNKSRPLNL